MYILKASLLEGSREDHFGSPPLQEALAPAEWERAGFPAFPWEDNVPSTDPASGSPSPVSGCSPPPSCDLQAFNLWPAGPILTLVWLFQGSRLPLARALRTFLDSVARRASLSHCWPPLWPGLPLIFCAHTTTHTLLSPSAPTAPLPTDPWGGCWSISELKATQSAYQLRLRSRTHNTCSHQCLRDERDASHEGGRVRRCITWSSTLVRQTDGLRDQTTFRGKFDRFESEMEALTALDHPTFSSCWCRNTTASVSSTVGSSSSFIRHGALPKLLPGQAKLPRLVQVRIFFQLPLSMMSSPLRSFLSRVSVFVFKFVVFTILVSLNQSTR